jgi:AcrR family transcriptional regulator
VTDPATTERLLDAAWEEATEQGVDKLTLANVAARAGVSRQAVYLHFGNRATLLVAMAARIDHTSGFRKRLDITRNHPAPMAYREMLEAWFDYVPTILPVSLALEAAWLTGGDGAAAYRDRMDDWRNGIRIAVARLHDQGALAAGWSIDTATDWTWATVHPTHYHHLTSEQGWTSDQARRRLITALEDDIVLADRPRPNPNVGPRNEPGHLV